MVNGLAETNLLLMMTERTVEAGDGLVERHAEIQRDCVEHAEQLDRLTELHERIGEMIARERGRFASYFPQKRQAAAAPPRLPQRPATPPRESANATPSPNQ